jgi:hypothetical protein
MANPEFHSKFLDHVVGLFQTKEGGLRVDPEHLKKLVEFVNNLKRTVKHTQPLFLDRN